MSEASSQPTGAAAAEPRGGREGRFEPPSVRAEQEKRSYRLLMLVVRSLFLVLLVTVTIMTMAAEERRPEDFDLVTAIGLFIAATAIGVIVLLVDSRTPNKRLTTVVGVYLGICVGLLGAWAIGALIDMVAEAWDIRAGRMAAYIGLAKVIIAIVLCYLSVSVVLTTKDDFRLVIPYVEFSKQVRGIRPMVLDTSALIDGRIESLGQTGFVDAPLIVPQFVVDELQRLADSSDKLKRARGRRGLNMVSKLQESPILDVSIDQTEITGHSVDHMLVKLAKEQNLRILTTDYNLNKVAQIQGVSVLNINDLANTVKSQAIPGETLTVEIVKPGEAAGQGVGYMPDGTMVVVEGAADLIGRNCTLMVTNSLQTSAGRMIFGKRLEEDESGVHDQTGSSVDAHDADEEAEPVGPPRDSAAEHSGEESPEAEQETPSRVDSIARAATHQPRIKGKPERIERTNPRRNPRR